MPSIDYAAIAPEIVVSVGLMLTLAADLGARRDPRTRVVTGVIALASLVLALGGVVVNAFNGVVPAETLSGLFVLDGFAQASKGLIIAASIVVVLLSLPPLRGHRYEGEYYFLLLCSVLGAMLMPSSRDLLVLFVALELVSVPAFVLAGIRKQNPLSNEAALKFFIIGVLSAGVFAYGISLVYGFAGTTELAGIAEAGGQIATAGRPPALLMTGVVFIVAAFGFKVSAVPFHFWAPDTYQGSPVALAAFLSVVSKAAGFVGLFVILFVGFPALAEFWAPIVGVVAALTMTLGNVLALKQRQLIRLLAYSSIAHAGYMLIPVALAATSSGTAQTQALVTYLIVYGVMNLGAFAVAVGLSKQYPTLLVRDLAGLGRRLPLTAFALAGFMISLGGIPPFAGWYAKFAVFLAAVETPRPLGVTLAALMVVNSVISLYYYLGIVRTMFLDETAETVALRLPRVVSFVVGVLALTVLVGGIYPEPVVRLARAATVVLF